MKKLFLSVSLFCLVLPLYSYVHCEFEGAGDVQWIIVNFEDPDGDCKSDYYEAWHIKNDGSVFYTPWGGGSWGMLDFSRWGCCNDYIV